MISLSSATTTRYAETPSSVPWPFTVKVKRRSSLQERAPSSMRVRGWYLPGCSTDTFRFCSDSATLTPLLSPARSASNPLPNPLTFILFPSYSLNKCPIFCHTFRSVASLASLQVSPPSALISTRVISAAPDQAAPVERPLIRTLAVGHQEAVVEQAVGRDQIGDAACPAGR